MPRRACRAHRQKAGCVAPGAREKGKASARGGWQHARDMHSMAPAGKPPPPATARRSRRRAARAARLEHVGAADHLVDGAEAHGGHVLAQLLGDQEEEVDHLLRRARKLGAQLRVLRAVRTRRRRQRHVRCAAFGARGSELKPLRTTVTRLVQVALCKSYMPPEHARDHAPHNGREH
jgi:hypothetical protein